MVDANHDGIDDQTGAPVGGQGDPAGIAPYLAAIAQSGGGAPVGGATPFDPQTAATNYLNSYHTSNIWQTANIVVGHHPSTQVEGGVTPASAANGLVPAPMHGGGGTVVHSPVPVHATPYALLADFDHWSRQQYLEFRNKLIAAGLVSDSAAPQDVKSVYSQILEGVVQAQADGNMSTPMDVINNYIRLNGLDPSKVTGSANYSATQPKTWSNTATSVYDLTPDNARATLRSALQAKLGRDPTDAEMRDFIDAAQTRATNNPTTSTTTYHTDASGNTTSNTSTDQGFGDAQLQEMALRRAKQAPDYAKYQSASTYYPALVSALGATVS